MDMLSCGIFTHFRGSYVHVETSILILLRWNLYAFRSVLSLFVAVWVMHGRVLE